MKSVGLTMNVTDEILSVNSRELRVLPAMGAKSLQLFTRCLPDPEPVLAEVQDVPDFIGAPDTIRSCDLCLRRATLYPAELPVRRAGHTG